MILLYILAVSFLIQQILILFQRNKGEEYKIDALERKQGLDPEADLRAEDFKEYQRPLV